MMLLDKAFPLLVQGRENLLVVHIIQTPPGEKYNVITGKGFAMSPEIFPCQSFYPVSLNCGSNIFFGDDKTDSGKVSPVSCGQ